MQRRTAEQLLCDAKSGDRRSLGELLRLYRNYLVVLAAAQLDQRLRRRISPSDVVQEVLLAAWRDFARFAGSSLPQFLAWIRKILINCIRRTVEIHLTTRKRDLRCEVAIEQLEARDLPSPGDHAVRQEQATAVENALARLRPDYCEVLVLRHFRGLSFAEIAVQLGRNLGAVRMLWLRAITKLKQDHELTC